MHDSTSAGRTRPRVRRGLGLLVGAAMLLTPMAMAPAASAQTGSGDALGGLDDLVAGILEGLSSGNTLAHPLGSGSSVQERCYPADGIGSTLSCVIVPIKNAIDPTPGTRAKVKAKVRRKAARTRWIMR